MEIFSKQSLHKKSRWLFGLALFSASITIALPLYVVLVANHNFRWQSTNQNNISQGIPEKKPVNQTVAALGRIQSKDKIINLSGPSSVQTARVSQILVKQGDKVHQGQVIAILDIYAQLHAALEKAKLDVKVAQAQLAQVKAGTTKQGDIAAQQARIADLEAQFAGNVATQKAQIARLDAELKNAQTDYARYQSLYQQGAVSATTSDGKRLAVETLQAQLNQAQAALNQVLTSFPNQIKEAKASLEKLKEIRPIDVQVAETSVEQTIASIPEAKAQLDLAYVRAPVNGQILKVNTFPGETISERGIVDLAQTQQMYIFAEIYETNIGKIKLGQKAIISSKALPEKLSGKVENIGVQISKGSIVNADPTLDIDSRVIEVKIRLDPAYIAQAANFINLQVDVQILTNNKVES
jgi:HlyD family secretion protein